MHSGGAGGAGSSAPSPPPTPGPGAYPGLTQCCVAALFSLVTALLWASAGAYHQAEKGEAYSDVTRFGNKTVAKQSADWAKSMGRLASTSREIDFVHRY
jgi:hypothetical protein